MNALEQRELEHRIAARKASKWLDKKFGGINMGGMPIPYFL